MLGGLARKAGLSCEQLQQCLGQQEHVGGCRLRAKAEAEAKTGSPPFVDSSPEFLRSSMLLESLFDTEKKKREGGGRVCTVFAL
jgi:hypothetical protein